MLIKKKKTSLCVIKLGDSKLGLVYTGLFKMIVGVLTTCHTQYTWDRSTCVFYLIEQHYKFLLHTSSHKYPRNEGTNQNRHWNHHRWHAERSRIIVLMFVESTAMASSFLRFLDHTRRITVGRTSLDEWSARRRDLYLTTHNTHNRHPCPRWDSNPHSQQASGRRLRPRGHWDRRLNANTWH